MSRVLLTARTRMNDNEICLGGLDLDANRCVRLFATRGEYFRPSAPFQVGHLYSVEYRPDRTYTLPHGEDVEVIRFTSMGPVDSPRATVLERKAELPFWEGGLEALFDGRLSLSPDNGQRQHASAAYVFEGDPLPAQSLGYWLPDRDLRVVTAKGKRDAYYLDPTGVTPSWRLRHNGLHPLPPVIPSGSLLSVSLARWWLPDNDRDPRRRCTLQLCDLLP